MRNSKQRELILNTVNNSYSHPTAEDVYVICKKEMPNISLGTVYRNLNLLVDTSNIRRIKAKDNAYRFDRNEDRHSHFVCNTCGKIIDIDKEFFGNVNEINGNKVLDYEVSLVGICKDCLRKRRI